MVCFGLFRLLVARCLLLMCSAYVYVQERVCVCVNVEGKAAAVVISCVCDRGFGCLRARMLYWLQKRLSLTTTAAATCVYVATAACVSESVNE